MYGEEEKAQKVAQSGEALRSHRETHLRLIAAEFRKCRAAVRQTLHPSEPLTVAFRSDEEHGDAPRRFIGDPEAPIDHSPTEREFQNVAKQRLNRIFAGRPRARTGPAGYGLALEDITPAVFKDSRQ